jgi:hypothetical protein
VYWRRQSPAQEFPPLRLGELEQAESKGKEKIKMAIKCFISKLSKKNFATAMDGASQNGGTGPIRARREIFYGEYK